MAEDLDHLRGRYAESVVRLHFGGCSSQADHGCDEATRRVKIKDYRGVVLNAIPFLRQCGLLQVAAYWYSKGDDERAVLRDVLGWLVAPDSARTRTVCEPRTDRGAIPATGDLRHVFDPLLKRSSAEVALLEAEAEALLMWLKRLVEGRWKGLPGGAPPPANQSTAAAPASEA